MYIYMNIPMHIYVYDNIYKYKGLRDSRIETGGCQGQGHVEGGRSSLATHLSGIKGQKRTNHFNQYLHYFQSI